MGAALKIKLREKIRNKQVFLKVFSIGLECAFHTSMADILMTGFIFYDRRSFVLFIECNVTPQNSNLHGYLQAKSTFQVVILMMHPDTDEML